MGNIVIATPEPSDAATLSASSETAAGPASNLQKMQKSDVWEAAAANPTIDIDLGSIQPIGFMAVLFSNLAAGTVASFATADTQGGLASPVYTSGNVAAAGDGDFSHWVDVPGVTVNNRWVRFSVTSAATSSTFGRLYVSEGYQPTLNFRYGYEEGFEDQAVVDTTDGGGRIPGPSLDHRILNLTLLSLSEAARHAVREIMRRRSATRDICLVTDPDAAANLGDRIFYGFLSARRATIQNRFNLHETTFQLTGL